MNVIKRRAFMSAIFSTQSWDFMGETLLLLQRQLRGNGGMVVWHRVDILIYQRAETSHVSADPRKRPAVTHAC